MSDWGKKAKKALARVERYNGDSHAAMDCEEAICRGEAEVTRLRDALEDIASVDNGFVCRHGEWQAIDEIVNRAKKALEGDDG